MQTQPRSAAADPQVQPRQPLRIQGVIPPEPHYSPGTYEVRLQLSRAMTSFEVQALKPISRRMHPVRCVLTLHDTTLERVAAQAQELASLIRRVEEDGCRLEREAKARDAREAADRAKESIRLTSLAHSIRFD